MELEVIEFKNINAIGFNVDDKYYIYDCLTNHILKVERIILDLIDSTFELSEEEIIREFENRFSKNEIKKALLYISDAQKKNGLFSNFKIKKMSISAGQNTLEKVINKLSNELLQIVFNVTENCNYRCQYCVYSGSYLNKRSHNTSNRLSFEIGQKAIDFFLENSKRSKDRFISFYGGEPLLEFNLIRQMINYSKSLAPDLGFSVTSNASLLDEDKLNFLAENNVDLMISLDGPEEIHNLYRVYSDNKNTYQTVIDKINLIKTGWPEYFDSKVRISTVLVPHNYDPIILDKFFADSELFPFIEKNNLKLTLGGINPEKNTFIETHNYDNFFKNFHYAELNLYRKYLVESLNISNIPVAMAYLFKNMKSIHCRSLKHLDEYSFYWPNGICIPGMRSLFVSSKGDLYPCEKIYDYQDMSIGNVETGFDFKKIADFIDEYTKGAIADCSDCWAFRFCSSCFLQSRENKKFNFNKRREYCFSYKRSLLSFIKLYISIRNEKENAFEYLSSEKYNNLYYNATMIED